MAVHYEVPAGKTMMLAGPANVSITGGETPVIVDTIQEAVDAAPTVSAIDPTTAESGAEDLVMTVTGTGFTAETVIIFGTMDEPTTMVSDTELTTGVKPSLFAPAAVPISVRNGPLHSNSIDFTFTDPGVGTRSSKRRAHAD